MNGNATKYPNAHQKFRYIQRNITGTRRQIGMVINALTASLKVLTNIWSLIIILRKISGTMKSRAVGIIETMNNGKRRSRPRPLIITASTPGL